MDRTRKKEVPFYILKNGRVVKEGDEVTVRLTPRIIKYFISIGVMKPFKGRVIKLSVEDLFNLLGI